MKIGIIGYGNVGRTFCEGVTKAKFVDRADIYVYNRGDARRIEAEKYGFKVCADASELFEKADIVLIAVKGYAFEEICLKNDCSSLYNKCIVSCMAGVTSEEIKQKIGVNCEVIRVMPTLSMSKLKGVTGAVKNNNEYVKKMFSSIGFYFEVEECDIEKVTAYSGCGLGFAAYLLNSYVKAGEALGFDKEISRQITKLTFEGALESNDYEDTVKKVATKGGATEQGVAFMENKSLDKLIGGAVKSAFEKYGR